MAPRFASETTVPSETSRAEIERLLRRYRATGFAYGWQGNRAMVQFEMADRRVKFILPMPERQAREFTHTPAKGQLRSPQAQEDAYEQAVRQRWRALLLVIKAKLEAVEVGITTFEDEFLAHILLPSGETVGERTRPQIALAYRDGSDLPPLLPVPGS